MRLPLKLLIFSTIGISLVASLWPDLQGFLALSRFGIKHGYLWQLLTYPFVERQFFSFGYLISVAFNMYVLWLFGSSLLERTEAKNFFILYFGAALLGGLSALAVSSLQLAGSSAPVYAVMTSWMIRTPGAQLFLFFTIPMQASWLILILVLGSAGLDLVVGQWGSATSLVVSVLFGYFFALFNWKEFSPFLFLRPLERKLLRMREKKPASPKIYDIHSGGPILNDEQFMDAMLEKISRQGESSLTPEEKARMDLIAKRKK